MAADSVLVLNAGSSSLKAAVLELGTGGVGNRLWQDQLPWSLPACFTGL